MKWPSLESIQDSPACQLLEERQMQIPRVLRLLLYRKVHSKALRYAPWLTCPGSWQQCRIRKDVFLPSSSFRSWGWWEWFREWRLFYSGLVESISGGSLAWVWPEVWALTSTRGRPHEHAQGNGRKSHLCDAMARARLLSCWPPFHHLPFNHVIWMLDGIECIGDFVNIWPSVWFTILIWFQK